MVDEDTGRVVESDQKGRGYELSKGRYVEIDEDAALSGSILLAR
jgi:DNA end-binding protein Ku